MPSVMKLQFLLFKLPSCAQLRFRQSDSGTRMIFGFAVALMLRLIRLNGRLVEGVLVVKTGKGNCRVAQP